MRLPHTLFSTASTPYTNPPKLGDLALVYVSTSRDRIFLCTVWPSLTAGTASLDRLIHAPVPPNAPIFGALPAVSTDTAYIYPYSEWRLFVTADGAQETVPNSRVSAASISIRFFGDASKNSSTITKKLQVRALLESKFVATGCIIAKDESGGMEIVDAQTYPPSTSQTPYPPPISVQYPLLVTSTTEIKIVHRPATASTQTNNATKEDKPFSNVGGMAQAKLALMDLLSLPLKHAEELKRLGTSIPRGILMHGPPGVGKTLLVKEAARSLGVPVVSISASEVYNPVLGESERILRELFERAERLMGTHDGDDKQSGRLGLASYTIGGHGSGGAVIFIDEIDAICSKRDDGGISSGQLETRIVAQLLTLLEQTKAVVVAATNRPNALDPALRRPGRFDRELAIPLPSLEDRIDILRTILRSVPLQNDIDASAQDGESTPSFREHLIIHLAKATQGWSGADLASLVREAALHALRSDHQLHTSTPNAAEEWHPRDLIQADFDAAMLLIQPASHRGWTVEVPKTTWNDIGGLEEVKKKLKMTVEWPVTHSDAFVRLGLDLPRGILLHGPPGCAKTTLVKAVANACKASFVCLSGADVYSPFLGEAERLIRDVFKKARAARPAIIFFDEIDSMVKKRGGAEGDAMNSRVLTTLLTEMDGIDSSSATSGFNDHVLVIAATNRPDQLDEALLRPGRFDRIIEIPLPDETTRFEILKVHTRQLPLVPSVDMKTVLDELLEVAQDTEGFSGADLEAICREAAILALKENIHASTIPVAFIHQSASVHGLGLLATLDLGQPSNNTTSQPS